MKEDVEQYADKLKWIFADFLRTSISEIIDKFRNLSDRLDETLDRLNSQIDLLINLNRTLNYLVDKLQVKIKRELIEENIIEKLEIRDIKTHISEIADISVFNVVTCLINNELDQPVTVQVKGNITPTTINACNIGDPVTVNAKDVDSINLSIYTNVWLPYIFVEVSCSVAPTSGALHVKLLKRVAGYL